MKDACRLRGSAIALMILDNIKERIEGCEYSDDEILGVICGGAGQIGDLFASSIKRYAGIKDYSRVFSEHGGVMDRLDSVLFCAPIIYAVFTIAGV